MHGHKCMIRTKISVFLKGRELFFFWLKTILKIYDSSLHIKKWFCVGSSKHFQNSIYLLWGKSTEFVYSPYFADGEAEAQKWRDLPVVSCGQASIQAVLSSRLCFNLSSRLWFFFLLLGSVLSGFAASLHATSFLGFKMGPNVYPVLFIREQHTIQLPSIESKHENAVVPDLSLTHTWCAALLKPI